MHIALVHWSQFLCALFGATILCCEPLHRERKIRNIRLSILRNGGIKGLGLSSHASMTRRSHPGSRAHIGRTAL
ncbi:hypothetical protein HMPREF0972_00969 [Actinomyces sp. oral taxon 848 str. F0332]|nr:hypothetical protein HMPREF0972_00969 [Actinomyces sp. oral taxon 848 str. F0332]